MEFGYLQFNPTLARAVSVSRFWCQQISVLTDLGDGVLFSKLVDWKGSCCCYSSI